jgi:RNA polymerase sigma-70 factor, ECF subfamily
MASSDPGEISVRRVLEVAAQPVKPSHGQALDRAYQRYYRDVYRYALAFTRSHDDAEEVAADTFERALKAWDRLPEPELPWLLLTARRIATDRWRRARALRRIALKAGRTPTEDESAFWVWFDELSAILNPRQKEVLVLRYQADLENADIGVIMRLSESGVRSLLARALHILRAHPELL